MAKRDTVIERTNMRLCYFNEFQIGIIIDDHVVDVTDHLTDLPHRDRQDLMPALIAQFADYRTRLEAACRSGDGIALSKVTLRPPLTRPATVDCMAVNYMEDGTRTEPAPINGFHKASSSIIGEGETMVLDDIPAEVFEGEAELAVIISKRADHISKAEAMNYVFGYTCFIDGSARGLPPTGNTFFQVKSRATFAPLGPWIVTADEIPDPHNLHIKLTNSGKIMQDFNTNDMAHKIPRIIEWLSEIHPLEAGDIVATGTNHRGLHPFMDGDLIELEIEKVGKLTINVHDDLKRTWNRVTRLQHAEKGGEGPYTKQVSGKHADAG
jgi:2-keto-4-pentenoate hydratase/2-oxohepta-3-ene-1,7-dioic acid hydratase in catechol pathway